MRPFALDLLKVLMHLLRVENEDNAVICLKIIIDMHRSYKQMLQDQVQPFLDIVQDMYRNMEQTVKDAFDMPATTPTPTPNAAPTPNPLSSFQSPRPMSPASDVTSDSPAKTLAKSLHSFKVLTECPIIVVLLFQSHRQFVNTNIQTFVPLIVDALNAQAKPQTEAHAAAKEQGEIFVGVSSAIKNRALYTELIVAQVKTMSFLAYILRGYTAALRRYQTSIPEFVIRLLQDCPPEASAVRKELLVATRHILSTELRSAFVGKIDILLNERVLIGTGITSFETLRPLGYSMLADLVHHVRAELSTSQLSRTVHIYSRNMHDPSLAPSIQTMCAKLLLNVIDCIVNIQDKSQARGLLLKILDAFVSKFAAQNALLAIVKERTKAGREIAQDATKAIDSKDGASKAVTSVEIMDEYDIDKARIVHTSAWAADATHDPLKDGRFLFKNLIVGLKTILYGLKHCNPPLPQGSNMTPQQWNAVARGFTVDEVDIFICLFREGIQCFEFYSMDAPSSEKAAPKLAPTSKEEREVLEIFANIFVHLDPAIFQEVLNSQLPFFFQQILNNAALLQIPQFLLASDSVSMNFAGILFRFLVDRLESLGGSDTLMSTVMLRLFKLAFMSVTLFPDTNESVLQPHLGNIIMSSLQMATKAHEPINYFLLLRALFRSIGGGRFELLYKEVFPLLQVLLETLNNLLATAHKPQMRELFVELCLTVPVRLSVLLPYLNYLMKPLVIALGAGPELVSQGLRTLELCIDNLTQEFLDPIMAPVIGDLMKALWTHLKPLPYSHTHSHTTMRILGKLGGRNRRMLKEPPTLKTKARPDVGIDVEIRFNDLPSLHVLNLDDYLDVAVRTLDDPKTTDFYKEQSFNFAKACIPLLVNLAAGSNDLVGQLLASVRSTLGEDTAEPMELDRVQPLESDTHSKTFANRRLCQEQAFKKVLQCLFSAALVPALQDNARPFLQDLYDHFALLEIAEAIEIKRVRAKGAALGVDSNASLDVNIAIDALIETFKSENSDMRKLGEEILQAVYNACLLVNISAESVGELTVFRLIASKFCSCCYEQSWFVKSGGCQGISILSSKLDLGTKWMQVHELEFVRALLYVLKDIPADTVVGNTEDATHTLSHVLKVCNRPEDNDDSQERSTKFNNLIGLLISELSNSNSAVRETIQSSFQLLADLTGSEVTELLSPVRDRLLTPIFTKPLRALPFAMQIGHIDAITYCLTLRPPFLEFNDELVRLLHEALALADAEDQALVSRQSQYKNATSLTNLRVVCIRLLSAAMACPEFAAPRNNSTRTRIISVFFKSLYVKATEVVEAANKGLKQVLVQQNKLPKDLLQAGLRPILMNLSDHRRLTVSGLECLARLLELLTNYFKVEIGRKLLDHLKAWAEPATIQDAAGKPLSENHEIKIITAILNIFHLLPSAAVTFLDDMILAVLDLESRLRRSHSSPFREPLAKYLNRYATEGVDYFIENLKDEPKRRLFVNVLGVETASGLRAEMAKNIDKLIEKGIPKEGEEDDDIRLATIMTIYQIATHTKDWIGGNKAVIDELLRVWKSPARQKRIEKEAELTEPLRKESTRLMEIFILYLQTDKDPEVIFAMLDIFTTSSNVDYGFLKRFYYKEIAMSTSADLKRAVLDKFFEMFADDDLSQDIKTQSLRLIINPLLLVTFSRPEEVEQVIDSALVEKVHAKIWRPILTEGVNSAACSEDALRIELLQLSTLFIQHVPDLISDARKDLIKFGWNYLKLDDVTGKQAAYVLVSHFIAAYETPPKIITQIYVALLRAHQSEGRSLVKIALDVLAPVLPRRIPTPAGSDAKFPTWAKWTRRVLVEDGNSVSQLVNVYQLLVRHPDLFYDSREHFMPQMVNTLSRLGLLPSSTPETRTLMIDLTELIVKWEQKRLKGPEEKEPEPEPKVKAGGKRSAAAAESARKKQAAESSTGQPTAAAPDYIPPLSLRETVIAYLTRFISTTPEPVAKQGLAHRAVNLMQELFQLPDWNKVSVKLSSVEKALIQTEITEQTVGTVCNALEVLSMMVKGKEKEWFVANIGHLQKLLEKPIKSEDAKVHDGLKPILQEIFDALPSEEEESSSAADFYSLVHEVVQQGAQNQTNIYGTLMLISVSNKYRPEAIDALMPHLVKVLQQLTKDHLQATLAQNAQAAAQAATGIPDYELTLKLLNQCLELVNGRVSILGDQRRGFLNALVQLIEKTQDMPLCYKMLGMVKDWIFGKTETFPTVKEKAAILGKMMLFETKSDPKLVEEYLDLVLEIYSTKAFTRSELSVRLEHAFLMGTRNPKPEIRNKFVQIFDRSMARSLSARLTYVFGVQSWDYLSTTFWLTQAADLLFGVITDQDAAKTGHAGFQTRPLTYFESEESEKPSKDLRAFVKKQQEFLRKQQGGTVSALIEPVRQLLYLDVQASYKLWLDFFPICWSAIGPKDRNELLRALIPLLAKDYHSKQIDARPNVIQAILDSSARCRPAIRLPPHLVKYLAKTFNAWHIGMELLERLTVDEDDKVRDGAMDALSELYATLSDDDMFYGLWRQRSNYIETNAALSFEQNGMWAQAQIMYENAQIKARTGVLPFTESEYLLWEDHWMLCSQKLQQWEILTDLAKHESNPDLLLECAWRLSDWSSERELLETSISSVVDSPTPRRRVFESFMALVKAQENKDKLPEFSRVIDEGVQLTLRKWFALPNVVTNSHVPLLQLFQQFVELQEANQIYSSLGNTNATNLDARSAELKTVLQTWRERLPNTWDDINVWSDLVAWRQHIFSAINKAYLPLIPMLQQAASGSATASTNSFAYRGYHETAWIINRFAHVARKHQLADVCINSLTKIYTLPNIEIQEAFLKLREQAKCHYQNPLELSTGLDVINNTNLMYFGSQQKAEFFTLKGMFQAKLAQYDDANSAFATAVRIDLGLAKAWAEWGHYNDALFKDKPTETTFASHAVSCFLQAAGLYRNSKSRKLLVRVLWLLSMDDPQGNISRAFDSYKGDMPVWQWITFIPQLLNSLAQKEARHCRQILIKIAKAFPQALQFQLRTTREDYAMAKRQALLSAQNAAKKGPNGTPQPTSGSPPAGSPDAKSGTPAPAPTSDAPTSTPAAADGSPPKVEPKEEDGRAPSSDPAAEGSTTGEGASEANSAPRQPWEYVDEIMLVLKTAFPLLALSMETMVDQIQQRLKPAPDEDIYRLIVALLNDGVQQLIGRLQLPNDPGQLTPGTEANIVRFAENLYAGPVRTAFEEDFIKSKPTLTEYVVKLRKWRDRFEAILDRRPKQQFLEHFSHYLVEFQHQKFDDIEVPGQYLQLKDNNNDFVRIDRFVPTVDILRGHGICFKRLTIRGHDGSMHPFAIQHPAARHSRREERIMQLFRILNSVLERRKESRRRNVHFHLPFVVPLAPQIRMVQDDPSYVTLLDVYEDHCREQGLNKDDAIIMYADKLKALVDGKKGKNEFLNMKIDIVDQISKIIPETALAKYMFKTMNSFMDLWLLRKHFTSQMASMTFITYVMSISQRHPHKIHISRTTGNIWTTELLPAPLFVTQESVPFRFTPNLQYFMTPIGIEGVFTSSLMAIARCLTEPEFQLDQYLSLFVRDELIVWHNLNQKNLDAAVLRDKVSQNVELIMRRAQILSCKAERENAEGSAVTPANQTILDLISQATNPQKIAQMDSTWMPWL